MPCHRGDIQVDRAEDESMLWDPAAMLRAAKASKRKVEESHEAEADPGLDANLLHEKEHARTPSNTYSILPKSDFPFPEWKGRV